MDIKFDKDNSNVILFIKDGKRINSIACPPIKEGCDIINLSGNIYNGYNFNNDSLILITTEIDRKLYHRGILIAEIKRQ
jgi:hypothetical protein